MRVVFRSERLATHQVKTCSLTFNFIAVAHPIGP
jgi:hypothetical protein